ncbi:MAG: helix-turn-helix domain-containing protein, partial [Chromatiaceae bacterium]
GQLQGREALRLARQADDPLLVAEGHWLLGLLHFCLGDYLKASDHLGEISEFYVPEEHHHAIIRLRGVDHQELITADLDPTRVAEGAGKGRRLATEDLSAVFGIDLDDESTPASRKPPATRKQTVSEVPTPTAEPPFAPTGPAIARLRERLGMNKSQFARLVGVSPPTITNWERKAGALDLHPDHLKCLRRASTLTERQAATRPGRASRQRDR